MDPQTMAMFAALGAALEPAIETQIGKVPQQYRAYIPYLVAGGVAATHSYLTGGNWQSAVANGIAVAAGSMVKHDAAPAGTATPEPAPAPASVPPQGPSLGA